MTSWMDLRGTFDVPHKKVAGFELIVLTQYGLDIRDQVMSNIAPLLVDYILDIGYDAEEQMREWATPILLDWMDPTEVILEGYKDTPLLDFQRQDWIDLLICFVGSDEEILNLLRKVTI